MPLAPALRGQLIRAHADVRLIGDHGDYEQIHSILLMTLSPYFEIVLNDNKPVRIDGADEETLKLIKQYAYEGKINLSERNIYKVQKVADMYNMIGILNECELFIRNTNIQEH